MTTACFQHMHPNPAGLYPCVQRYVRGLERMHMVVRAGTCNTDACSQDPRKPNRFRQRINSNPEKYFAREREFIVRESFLCDLETANSGNKKTLLSHLINSVRILTVLVFYLLGSAYIKTLRMCQRSTRQEESGHPQYSNFRTSE